MARTEEQLIEYFRECTKGTGKIGPEDLRSLCANLGIGQKEADAIFENLDCDNDGEINIDDFIRGYRNESSNMEKNRYSNRSQMVERRTSDVKLAWAHLIQGVGEPSVVHEVLNNSEKELKDFFHKLAATPECSSELVDQFEKTLSLVLQDMINLHDDKQKVEQKYKKQSEIHRETMKNLEEDLDAQLSKIEAEAKEQARLMYEKEKKELLQRFEEEKAGFAAQLKLYHKYNTILSKKRKENINLQQQHGTTFENEKLDSILSDSTANLALFHSELAQLKAEQQEARCREANSQQETALYYEHMNRKLALIEEANRSLKDTNDNLFAIVETKLAGRASPYCVSRAGSDSDILERDHFPNSLITRSSIQNHLPNDQTHQSGSHYVIQRLMEDIDSGHSTLRDPIECDSDHKSIQEEFSDAESQLKSLESDDSKTYRRRTNKSEYVCTTPNSIMSFETTGDPDRTYKVVFAGDAAVGKSCFIHRFCKGNFASRLGSTLGVDFQIKTIRVDEKNIALQLWDTAGQERFRSMTKTYFRRADGVVLVYDVTSERTFLNIRQWIQSINESADKEIPILICGNKIDLREETRHLGANCVETIHGQNLAKDYNALFFETSSKTGKNIFDAIIAISREMLLREDVEVQTSSLQVSNVHKPSLSCC